jgi:Leucine-rich repeat (LRR) protein
MEQLLDLIEQAWQEGMTELDWSGLGLTEIPEQIGNLTHLTHFSLRGNQLTTLPAGIGRLTNLQHLSLADNQLLRLPNEIGRLSELTHLNVRNNRLGVLPTDMLRLQKLQMLQLAGNPLPIPAEILAKWDRPAEILDYYRTHHAPLVVSGEPIDPHSLHWLIIGWFDEEELAYLCQDICVPYESLPGTTLLEKAVALVQFHEQHGLMPEFEQLLRFTRPLAFRFRDSQKKVK